MKKQQATTLVTGLFLIVLVLSGYLYYLELNKIEDSTICNFNERFNCDEVANSSYAQTFGISNSLLGIILSVLVLTFVNLNSKKQSKKLFEYTLLGLILASAFSIYFLVLQFFVIKTICPFCLVIDLAILISLFLFWKYCK